jgi:hypothetical protein
MWKSLMTLERMSLGRQAWKPKGECGAVERKIEKWREGFTLHMARKGRDGTQKK